MLRLLNPFRAVALLWRKWRITLPFISGIACIFAANWSFEVTSTNNFCESCHVHPQATLSWKQGPHFDTVSGVIANCVDCHLPPGGFDLISAKIQTGARDIYGVLFKDESSFDWISKSSLNQAKHHVYKTACLNCHKSLFTKGLSKKGQTAHLHYSQKEDELRCINCHLDVGHYQPKKEEAAPLQDRDANMIFTEAAQVDSFVNFTEQIPGSVISFKMVALPGGEFTIGSPEDEPGRQADEGPQRRIKISPIWMGQVEVSWDEFDAYYRATSKAGRSEDQIAMNDVDAISGPTPAYGDPSQGWGRGKKPAITMSHFAATKYCQWLSKVTGKKYRLPTEAEWEYAGRAGTDTPYFFKGVPADFDPERLRNRIFGVDTSINRFVKYAANSKNRTTTPGLVDANPFGLKNMSGNVMEFCSDWYSESAYSVYSAQGITTDPQGPSEGTEHVVRGGGYSSDPAGVRAAARSHTNYKAWMRTDPQAPKSLWWYSDNAEVGFRVVCEKESVLNK